VNGLCPASLAGWLVCSLENRVEDVSAGESSGGEMVELGSSRQEQRVIVANTDVDARIILQIS
jgi:hypothetical protein